MKGRIGTAGIIGMLVIGGYAGLLNISTMNATGTNVSGIISTDAAWDLGGSPWIVTGDVTVAGGATLTIDPGVEVKFDGYHSIFIDGSLVAVGLQTNKITITSNKAVPGPKDWDRIQINSTGHAEIRYTDISYGTYGVYLDSSPDNYIMNNNIFYNGQFTGGAGIYLKSSSNNEITNNDFTYNWNNIYLDLSSNNNITVNNISSTFERGIILESSSNNNMTANNISNIGGGFSLSSSSYNYITGNNFSNDGGCICLSSSSNNSIIGNRISANSWSGIDLQSSSDDNLIEDNEVKNSIEGIYLAYSGNNMIKTNNLIDNVYGIHLDFSSNNNTITGNNLSDNELGIQLRSSLDVSLTNNNLLNDGISIWGDEVSHYTTHMIPGSNLVNGKPLYYYKNCEGINIDSVSVGQLILANCENVIVKNLQINNTYAGIEVAMSANILISNNNLSNNYIGIYLRLSSNNIITSNVISDNDQGLELWSSSNGNSITGNVVSNNGRAIWLFSSSNSNIITGNNVSENTHGISILSSSLNNKIYHNNFIDNLLSQALDDADNNVWNALYPSGGNYWSDWTSPDLMNGPNQDVSGSDGIVDNPYVIDADSQDEYPLVNPIWSPDTIPPTIANLQPPNASKINDNTPTLSVDYSDFSGIDINSIALKVDGIDVTSLATATLSGVTYTSGSTLADGNHTIQIEVRDASVNSNPAAVTWYFIVDTLPPAANAGDDKNIKAGDTVEFNGSASTDSIDYLNQLNFTWNVTKDGIPVITLYGAVALYKFDNAGEYKVNLTVRDTAGNAGYYTMTVTVSQPSSPTDNFLADYWWALLLLVIIVFFLALFLLKGRRKKMEVELHKEKNAEEEKGEETEEELMIPKPKGSSIRPHSRNPWGMEFSSALSIPADNRTSMQSPRVLTSAARLSP
jgi:parallel beta-helix repeat protein